jgi:sarcosine oxidase
MDADVIVIGLGAMGAAATYELTTRGQRVIGIDRWAPPHPHGSSHGRTRIIREAYFEHPSYVPLVQRAYERWADIGREWGSPLLRMTGGLMIGRPDGMVAGGAELSARTYGLPYQRLTAEEMRRRFPQFRLSDGMVAIHEPRAGVLFVEEAIDAMLTLARRGGATLRLNEPVVSWSASAARVEVTTTAGMYTAPHAVIAAGAWMRSLVPDVAAALHIERTRVYWFRPAEDPGQFAPERFPIFIIESGGDLLYGFPDLGEGVKVALHHGGDRVEDADAPQPDIPAGYESRMRGLLARHLPAANGELLASSPCFYTNTPDFHFILDLHPAHANVVVASPCSGHGFKFASVVGEIAADLALHGRTKHDIGLFGIHRSSDWDQPAGIRDQT